MAGSEREMVSLASSERIEYEAKGLLVEQGSSSGRLVKLVRTDDTLLTGTPD